MGFRTLDGVDVAGKRVLLRADLNVPVRDGKISDLTRIERLSPPPLELEAKALVEMDRRSVPGRAFEFDAAETRPAPGLEDRRRQQPPPDAAPAWAAGAYACWTSPRSS